MKIKVTRMNIDLDFVKSLRPNPVKETKEFADWLRKIHTCSRGPIGRTYLYKGFDGKYESWTVGIDDIGILQSFKLNRFESV